MRNKLIGYAIAALALVALAAPPAHAQADLYGKALFNLMQAEPVGVNITAVNTTFPLIVKYIGTNANGGTVTVAANGDITLAQGAVGSATADATIKCPSGGSNGIIDVSDTACDTFGEVVDIINASANWRGVILDGFRAGSSNDTLATLAEASANAADGKTLARDDAVADFTTVYAMTPERLGTAFWDTRSFNLVTNPYLNRRTIIQYANETSTYGSGTSFFEVLSCVVFHATTGGSETCTTLFSEAGGATTVNKVFDSSKFTPYGVIGAKGAKVLVRIRNSAAHAAPTIAAYGFNYRYQ